MVAAAVQWANRIMRKIDNGNERAWFVLSNLNLHISSSNMVDSRNSNKQSHGSFDRGSTGFLVPSPAKRRVSRGARL